MVGPQFDPLGTGGINFVHLNVASILGARKFEMLKHQLENSNVDIFCVSETWLAHDIPDGLVMINGFNFMRLDRAWSELPHSVRCKTRGGA